MKIKYEFADGTVSEVEVEESIGAVIIEDRRRLWGENPHDPERHPRHYGRGSSFRSCRNGKLVPRPEDLGGCILAERGVQVAGERKEMCG